MAFHVCTQMFFAYVSLILFKNSEQNCIVKSKETGVSYCDSLNDVYSNSNSMLKFISVSKKGDLEEFKTVSVESARSIETLSVHGGINKISENAFKNFNNLKRLDFLENKLNTIKVEDFGNLNVTVLNLYNCSVETITKGAFSKLNKLQELRFPHNNLTIIENGVFNNLSTVHTLVLSSNQIGKIEKLSFGGMPILKKLYLDNNRLTEFDVQECISNPNKLERLWLHKNNLTQITSYMLEGLSNLKILNLGFNSISSIEPQSFTETPKLSVLVLTHNLIKVIDGAVLPTGGLTELKILYLDHNRLMYLSSNFLFRLNFLQAISLGGNPWQCPCLDLVMRWLADNNVKLSCDKNYFSGNRPVCVFPNSKNVCVYSYDDKLYELFQSTNSKYPPAPFCLL